MHAPKDSNDSLVNIPKVYKHVNDWTATWCSHLPSGTNLVLPMHFRPSVHIQNNNTIITLINKRHKAGYSYSLWRVGKSYSTEDIRSLNT